MVPGYSKSTAVCGEVNLPSFARRSEKSSTAVANENKMAKTPGGVGIVDWGPGWFLATKLFCWGRWELLDERSSILVQIFDRCLLNVYSCQWPPEVICWFNSCIYIRLSKMLRWCWRFVSFNHISDWKFVITKWEARWPQQKMCCFTCFARSCLCFPVVCWGYEWNMTPFETVSFFWNPMNRVLTCSCQCDFTNGSNYTSRFVDGCFEDVSIFLHLSRLEVETEISLEICYFRCLLSL